MNIFLGPSLPKRDFVSSAIFNRQIGLRVLVLSFFKWAIPGLFFIYLRLLKQTLLLLQQINVKNVQKSWDLNPRPSGHESPSIITRPGLLPSLILCYFHVFNVIIPKLHWKYWFSNAHSHAFNENYANANVPSG